MAHNIDAATLDLKETVVVTRRVSKTVKGGRIMRFAAVVVVGDQNGHVGYGLGKSAEVLPKNFNKHCGSLSLCAVLEHFLLRIVKGYSVPGKRTDITCHNLTYKVCH